MIVTESYLAGADVASCFPPVGGTLVVPSSQAQQLQMTPQQTAPLLIPQPVSTTGRHCTSVSQTVGPDSLVGRGQRSYRSRNDS